MTAATQIDPTDDVDPDIRQFIKTLNHGYGQFSDFNDLPMPARRQAAEHVRAQWREGGPEMASTINVEIKGVRARIYVPVKDQILPAMLYIHGGGWTMFSIDTHDRLMREYAARAGFVVIGIDYTLSPEEKFPKALDEIIAVYHWLRAEGAQHGVDTSKIAIGGDSAGANLSVAASLKLRDAGNRLPDAMLLNYGAYGPDPTATYERYDGPDYMLTVSEMNQFWANYVGDPSELVNPLVAPIYANLHELPPAFMVIAECDILTGVNLEMADRMKSAGVQIEKHIYRGATHSFLEAMSISRLADRAIQDSADWLKRRFSKA